MILVVKQLVILWKWLEKMLVEVLGDVGDDAVVHIMEVVGEHVV